MKRTVATMAAIMLLTGCAASPSQFYANRRGISNTQLCGAMFSTYAKDNYNYYRDIGEEANRRGLASSDCETMNRQTNAGIGAAALFGLAIIAAAKGGGGGNGFMPSDDDEWDWDEFRNQYGNLIWACRGVQTGEFAEDYRCSRKLRTDSRWPQK